MERRANSCEWVSWRLHRSRSNSTKGIKWRGSSSLGVGVGRGEDVSEEIECLLAWTGRLNGRGGSGGLRCYGRRRFGERTGSTSGRLRVGGLSRGARDGGERSGHCDGGNRWRATRMRRVQWAREGCGVGSGGLALDLFGGLEVPATHVVLLRECVLHALSTSRLVHRTGRASRLEIEEAEKHATTILQENSLFHSLLLPY